MRNIILFGGAFDPIHLGHLNMAKAASETLDAEVIFIPAKISVWKNESAPIEDKIKMIELAIKDYGYNRFSLSRYEADSKSDINYSIDTVHHFKSIYPNDCLYLLHNCMLPLHNEIILHFRQLHNNFPKTVLACTNASHLRLPAVLQI